LTDGLAVAIWALCSPVCASAAAPADITAPVATADEVQRGKELYVRKGCSACHGYDGQGGSYTGPRIAPDPMPWQAIAAFIRNPPGLEPPYLSRRFNIMPPYTSKMLSDQEVRGIYVYLSSRPPPVGLQNIPTFAAK